MRESSPFTRIAGILLALTLAAAPRAVEALPASVPLLTAKAVAPTHEDSRTAEAVAAGFASQDRAAAAADSARGEDAILTGPYALIPGGGFTISKGHAVAPWIGAGFTIAAVAAPALLFGGRDAHHSQALAVPGASPSPELPIVMPDPKQGMIDPPALDVTPSAVGSGPAAPVSGTAPEPPTALLLAAGLAATLGVSLARRR